MSCMYKLDDFKSDFRFIHDEIDDRFKESADNLESLPELMCEIFSTCENTLAAQKNSFISELDEVISKQLASFKRDNQTKVPNFYERLSQKYTQLQQATCNTASMSDVQVIETLENYLNIFMQLDSEFEKYFSEFENVSKLQRLLDKDDSEIIKDFTSMIENNLRVDYNIKNSFRPGVPARVHSF